jgi:penicillin-binding protein 1A
VGFDDNRSLGEHETGAVAAVPIFIDFMQQALKDKPIEDFPRPKGAVFKTVHGFEEAFHPGSEPKYDTTVAAPGSTEPYQIIPPGTPAKPGQSLPVIGPPPSSQPPKKKVPDDLNGLY